tara:strand:+ start:212 stop:550 length:339 start_codon:yes stop_codon:yes gene_type:complete
MTCIEIPRESEIADWGRFDEIRLIKVQSPRKKSHPSKYLMFLKSIWRGCANVYLKEFKIALRYSMEGESSVLLGIRSTGFMNLDADLMWLSAFPFEQELLYAPLRFLKPKPH